MAPSEWTCSVRAVRDTPVADYSVPSINAVHHVVFRTPIAVSMFLPVLLVSYLKQSLWHCGQQWPYVGMGLLGTHLHWHCNSMGGSAKISPPVLSHGAQNEIISVLIIHTVRSHQISVAIDNQELVPSISSCTTHSDLWNYVFAANIISHAETLQSNGCWCFSYLNTFRDRIQVTWVFRYCAERQGEPVLKESFIIILQIDFE
jgi:hypothetical protein